LNRPRDLAVEDMVRVEDRGDEQARHAEEALRPEAHVAAVDLGHADCREALDVAGIRVGDTVKAEIDQQGPSHIRSPDRDQGRVHSSPRRRWLRKVSRVASIVNDKRRLYAFGAYKRLPRAWTLQDPARFRRPASALVVPGLQTRHSDGWYTPC